MTKRILMTLLFPIVFWIAVTTIAQRLMCPKMTETELLLHLPKSFICDFKESAIRYRIEQYYYFKGKNFEGQMWNDVKKINGAYSYKIPDGFNPNYRESHDQFDSVVFKIVEVK